MPDQSRQPIPVVENLGQQFGSLEQAESRASSRASQRRVWVGLAAAAIVLTAGAGAYAAIHGFSGNGQLTPVVRSLCGSHQNIPSENIVDELDVHVKPNVVQNIAQREFPNRVVTGTIHRSSCPSTFTLFIQHLTPAERSELFSRLRAKGGIDTSRVSTRTVGFDRQDVLSSHKLVDAILEKYPRGDVVSTESVFDMGLVKVEARSIPKRAVSEIRRRVDLPVRFHIDPDLKNGSQLLKTAPIPERIRLHPRQFKRRLVRP